MIWFVHRENGAIQSAHQPDARGQSPMPGYCPEAIDDGTAEFIAFAAKLNKPKVIDGRLATATGIATVASVLHDVEDIKALLKERL